MLAFRRFVARRSMPVLLCSDNAKTFQGAPSRMSSFFGECSPKWQYIAPASPWWGGWWERLVRSVKSALRKSFVYRRVPRSELETSLIEVEMVINSRPITFLGDDLESALPLTPGHFLNGKPINHPCSSNIVESSLTSNDLALRSESHNERLADFWKRWSSDYLANLPPLINRCRSGQSIEVGSLVLLREDNLPRLRWPVCLIEEVYPGRDGIVRAVKVRTSKGSFVRPVQRLHLLEVSRATDTGESANTSSFQRPQRTRRPVVRMDL